MCLDSRKYAIKTFPFLHCPITLYKCTSTWNILNSAWKVYRFWHWTSIYLTFLILFYALCWHSFFSCVQVIVFFLFNELIEMTIYNVIHKGACTRKKHIVKWSYDIFLINCVKCIIIHPLLAPVHPEWYCLLLNFIFIKLNLEFDLLIVANHGH